MESLILTKLQATPAVTSAFSVVALAETAVIDEASDYPAAYVYDLQERGADQPSQRGARQIVTRELGVQLIAERADMRDMRSLIDAALVGWTPAGALSHIHFLRGSIQRLQGPTVIWLDVYACDWLQIREL